MCLIIYIPPNVTPPARSVLMSAAKANPDGWGVMFAHGGCLYTSKSLQPFSQDQFHGGPEPIPRVYHFRTASSSSISTDQSHPLKVTDTTALCHNGNLFEFSDQFATGPLPNDLRSDTQRFIERILRRLPPFTQWTWELRSLIGGYFRQNLSKAVLMDNQAQVMLLNEKAGTWRGGCWFSNSGLDGYTGYGFSGVHYYRPGDVRHPGGLTSVAMFPDHRRDEWYQCPSCFGWYPSGISSSSVCPNCATYLQLLEAINEA